MKIKTNYNVKSLKAGLKNFPIISNILLNSGIDCEYLLVDNDNATDLLVFFPQDCNPKIVNAIHEKFLDNMQSGFIREYDDVQLLFDSIIAFRTHKGDTDLVTGEPDQDGESVGEEKINEETNG